MYDGLFDCADALCALRWYRRGGRATEDSSSVAAMIHGLHADIMTQRKNNIFHLVRSTVLENGHDVIILLLQQSQYSKRGVHSCRLLSLADFGHFLRRECLVVQSNAMIQSQQAVSLWAAQTWMSDQCRKIIARARTKPGSDGSRWRSLTWPGGFPSGWPGRSCASTSVPALAPTEKVPLLVYYTPRGAAGYAADRW